MLNNQSDFIDILFDKEDVMFGQSLNFNKSLLQS